MKVCIGIDGYYIPSHTLHRQRQSYDFFLLFIHLCCAQSTQQLLAARITCRAAITQAAGCAAGRGNCGASHQHGKNQALEIKHSAGLAQAAGSQHWWRMREAALLAAGNAVAALADADDGEEDTLVDASAFDIRALLGHVLEQVNYEISL